MRDHLLHIRHELYIILVMLDILFGGRKLAQPAHRVARGEALLSEKTPIFFDQGNLKPGIGKPAIFDRVGDPAAQVRIQHGVVERSAQKCDVDRKRARDARQSMLAIFLWCHATFRFH